MKRITGSLATAVALMWTALLQAQPPQQPQLPTAEAAVEQMMKYDKNEDGSLTADEITDQRMLPILKRADADENGIVTKKELTTLAEKDIADAKTAGPPGGPNGPGFGPPGGPGFGPPGGLGGRGKFGFGGPPPGDPAPPGQVLSESVLTSLNLTPKQKKQMEALQKLVDERLAKILTDEQKQQLQQMQMAPPPGGPEGPEGAPGENDPAAEPGNPPGGNKPGDAKGLPKRDPFLPGGGLPKKAPPKD